MPIRAWLPFPSTPSSNNMRSINQKGPRVREKEYKRENNMQQFQGE